MPVECARELLGVTFSEHAGKYFFVLRNEHMVVEADSTMQDIMEKLQCYANRLTLVFQVQRALKKQRLERGSLPAHDH